MNKTILISITAALLLCAVLCTAGCVEAPSDAIVGDWVSETDDSVTYAVFENDGSGYFAADKDSVLTLEWKANGDKTYTFLFADGTTKTASVNAEHGLMTMNDGCVLEKQPNRLSGTVYGLNSQRELRSLTCPNCGDTIIPIMRKVDNIEAYICSSCGGFIEGA